MTVDAVADLAGKVEEAKFRRGGHRGREAFLGGWSRGSVNERIRVQGNLMFRFGVGLLAGSEEPWDQYRE